MSTCYCYDKSGNLRWNATIGTAVKDIEYIGDGFFLITDTQGRSQGVFLVKLRDKTFYQTKKLISLNALSSDDFVGVTYDGMHIICLHWTGVSPSNYTIRYHHTNGSLLFSYVPTSTQVIDSLAFDGKYIYSSRPVATDKLRQYLPDGTNRQIKMMKQNNLGASVSGITYDGKSFWTSESSPSNLLIQYERQTMKQTKALSAARKGAITTDGNLLYLINQ